MVNAYLLAAAMLAPVAYAQGAAYQQCGGIGHNGPTTCVSGYTCTFVNDWYSQCLPGAATTTPRPSTTSTTTRPTTTPPSTTRTTTTPTTPPTTTRTSTSPTTAVTTPAPTGTGTTVTGNIFAGKTQWANPYYASEVSQIAIPSFIAAGKPALASAAAAVAKVPSFTWLDTRAKIPSVRQYLQKIRDDGLANTHIAPFVVYDLPDRDCSAAASNGELHLNQNGAALYKTDYIDKIRAILLDFPEIPVVLIIEPDSLANMVTNMNVAKCQGAASAYHELTVYAVKQLALPNVSMYLDGGHGGWLGWPANLPGAGQVLGQVYVDAGKPKQLRGLATNVSNYNAWSIATCPAYTSPNVNCDEKRFVAAIAPVLAANGWPDAKFTVDVGRSGKQPTGQIEQGHWCNARGTGFGARPSSNTGDSLVDAFVWIKPGGESDGTSDTSADRYDTHCGLETAVKPAPEAGHWFQAYFEQLLTNANPAF